MKMEDMLDLLCYKDGRRALRHIMGVLDHAWYPIARMRDSSDSYGDWVVQQLEYATHDLQAKIQVDIDEMEDESYWRFQGYLDEHHGGFQMAQAARRRASLPEHRVDLPTMYDWDCPSGSGLDDGAGAETPDARR
jgi:hypothetical protein